LKVAVFGITGSHLVLPIFGLITGGLTDYVALTMIFRPKQSRAIAPGIRWQSLFHAKRDQVTRDYAKLLAKDILTPAAIMESLLTGALSPSANDGLPLPDAAAHALRVRSGSVRRTDV
jgi:uncharacterized membrane protein YheB (UPF0754 family)